MPTDHPQPFEIALQVAALSGGAERLVTSGETLRSGDRLAMEVLVDAAVFVYVVQAAADGTPALLFPRAGDQQVLPGASLRLPGPDEWFRLDRQVGEDTVYVVASRQPMGQTSLASRLGLSFRGLFRGDDEPPPPPLSDGDRRPVRAAKEAVVARSDGGGVAIVRFSYHHAP